MCVEVDQSFFQFLHSTSLYRLMAKILIRLTISCGIPNVLTAQALAREQLNKVAGGWQLS
jgi:hypothetical protein